MTRARALNVELLERVKAHILEEPRRLDMGLWADSEGEAPCGTVGCIAGWAIILGTGARFDRTGFQLVYRNNRPVAGFAHSAAKLLGLSIDQANEVFCVGGWPDDLADMYDSARDDRGRAEATAKRINRLIAEHTTPVASAPASAPVS